MSVLQGLQGVASKEFQASSAHPCLTITLLCMLLATAARLPSSPLTTLVRQWPLPEQGGAVGAAPRHCLHRANTDLTDHNYIVRQAVDRLAAPGKHARRCLGTCCSDRE